MALNSLKRPEKLNPDIPIIMISGHGNIDTAVEAVKKKVLIISANHLILTGCLITLRNATENKAWSIETKVLKRKAGKCKWLGKQSVHQAR